MNVPRARRFPFRPIARVTDDELIALLREALAEVDDDGPVLDLSGSALREHAERTSATFTPTRGTPPPMTEAEHARAALNQGELRKAR